MGSDTNDIFKYSIHYSGNPIPNLVINKLAKIGYDMSNIKGTISIREAFLSKNGKFSISGKEESGMILCESLAGLLTVAALRDDIDKYQWFTDELNHWEECPQNKAYIQAWRDFYGTIPHKATLYELSKKFTGITKIGTAWKWK